jgi:hypothetical protein
MKPYTEIATAQHAVEQFDGLPEDFHLPISDELQDPTGIAMAILTDAVLAKGWDVDGFDQRDGYRIYRYKSFE